MLKEVVGSLPDQLVVTLVYGFDRDNRATPAFMDIRFIDADGRYINDNLDLMALCREAEVPKMEDVRDDRKTQPRDYKKSDDQSSEQA